METKIARSSRALGIFLLFACLSLRTEAAFDPDSFARKLIILEKVLTYINDRIRQMNVDATFSITLTQANLAAAFYHKNVRQLQDEFFISLQKMCALSDLTRRNLMLDIVPESEIETSLQSALNNITLWTKPISWTRLFPENKPVPKTLSYAQVIESIQQGWPNEWESDQCLFKIIQSALNDECRMPHDCAEALMKEDNATGYSLTHRLLMIQVAQKFGCRETASLPFSYLVPALCAKIYQDFINLEAWNFPGSGRDLMIEQILLCGMEGYREFLDKHYEDLIVNWPHWSGCFKIERFSERHKMTRRSSSSTDFGCDNHMTGLGAASLALFIRENVENEFGS